VHGARHEEQEQPAIGDERANVAEMRFGASLRRYDVARGSNSASSQGPGGERGREDGGGVCDRHDVRAIGFAESCQKSPAPWADTMKPMEPKSRRRA
jgi:hypothetical protein